MALALATGIAPSVWAEQTDQAIETALTFLLEPAEQAKRGG